MMSPFIFMNSKMISLLIISLSLANCYAFDGRKTVESHYDTFDVHSLLSTSCKDYVQGPASRLASMKVTHKHCSKPSQRHENIPSLLEVLTHDKIRVASIQNSHAYNAETNRLGSSKATIPAKSGITVGTGNYVVSVGLGSPAKYVTLVFDTGSSLTWTQCQPCVKFCYKQNDPIFNPLTSTSYGNISCNSAECSELLDATGNTPDCSSSPTCIYGIQYGDQSFSVGFLAKERLTLTPHDVFENFLFGCGENNRGLFGNSAGLLGLGRDSISVVSQTAKKYGKYFSYCLPTKSGSNGHLTFGKYQAPRNLVFTPLTTSSDRPSFYFVNTIAISVGGKQLPISQSVFQSGGTIIDSGTVITRLAPTAYTTLRDAFKQQMSKYPTAPALSLLDTCFDFSNYTTITIPKISFIFAGNAKVDLGFTGILLAASQSQVCLAFAPNDADTDTGIYGNIQQQTYEVAYDVAGGRLGFGLAGCS